MEMEPARTSEQFAHWPFGLCNLEWTDLASQCKIILLQPNQIEVTHFIAATYSAVNHQVQAADSRHYPPHAVNHGRRAQRSRQESTEEQ